MMQGLKAALVVQEQLCHLRDDLCQHLYLSLISVLLLFGPLVAFGCPVVVCELLFACAQEHWCQRLQAVHQRLVVGVPRPVVHGLATARARSDAGLGTLSENVLAVVSSVLWVPSSHLGNAAS